MHLSICTNIPACDNLIKNIPERNRNEYQPFLPLYMLLEAKYNEIDYYSAEIRIVLNLVYQLCDIALGYVQSSHAS